jgi:hypothetical protein
VRRILALAVLAVVGFWGGCALWRSFADDESKIRWLLEDAVLAFNSSRPGYAVAPLADDWYDRTSGVHRDTLKSVLIGQSLQARGGKREMPWHLSLPRETLVIQVREDTATAAFELVLKPRDDEDSDERWRLAVRAELVDGDDGWKIAASSHETLAGRRP